MKFASNIVASTFYKLFELLVNDIDYNWILTQNIAIKLVPGGCLLHFCMFIKVKALKQIQKMAGFYFFQPLFYILRYEGWINFAWI